MYVLLGDVGVGVVAHHAAQLDDPGLGRTLRAAAVCRRLGRLRGGGEGGGG